MKNKDVLELYNLPTAVQYCKRCVLSNQRPRVTFDRKGVCSACNFSDHKNGGIDWVQRERELRALCDAHRKNNGDYDVIVPASGGKDSSYVAHMLKQEYGMTPLTVTWAPHIYTEIGKRNLTNFVDSGFDNILVTPRGDIHRLLTKAAFLEMGDPFQPFIFGQYTTPFRAALQYNVGLIFYGEDGEVEYGGSMSLADRPGLEFEDFVANRFSKIYPEHFLHYGLEHKDIKKYQLSSEEIEGLNNLGIKQRFFSYYKKWVPQENFYYSMENCGFLINEERSEGTYTKFASLDDKLDGFHYFLAFIKFGIGRCTSDAAHEIRDGYITREEGVSLVKLYDGEFPYKHFEDFLKYCDITEGEFWEVIDSWRSPHLWERTSDGWTLKHQVY